MRKRIRIPKRYPPREDLPKVFERLVDTAWSHDERAFLMNAFRKQCIHCIEAACMRVELERMWARPTKNPVQDGNRRRKRC